MWRFNPVRLPTRIFLPIFDLIPSQWTWVTSVKLQASMAPLRTVEKYPNIPNRSNDSDCINRQHTLQGDGTHGVWQKRLLICQTEEGNACRTITTQFLCSVPRGQIVISAVGAWHSCFQNGDNFLSKVDWSLGLW